MPTLSAAQVAQLVTQAGFPADVHVTMVAVAKAESGFRTDAVGGPNSNGTYDRGLFQIGDVHKLDRNRLTGDATYNTAQAKKIYDSQGLRAWSSWSSGAWRKHENEARQGVAQSAGVVGSPTVVGGGQNAQSDRPSITYGPPGPQITIAGVGTPLSAAGVIPGPLQGLRVTGVSVAGDFSTVVIGTPKFVAGWDTVPNLTFTIADPRGDLLWQQRSLWQRGVRVTWEDLDMRLDEITFAPGGHSTGQLEISAIDGVVYALMNLRGPRVASGISAVTWLAQELQLCGIDPNRYLLGEAVPTQSEISRDIPDPEGQAGSGDVPSAWTTIVRLAKELGKRVFISGSRLVFGSASFAMRWAAPGDLRLGDGMEPGEEWLTMPTRKDTSIGNRSGVTEVNGRVPLNRAKYFRPGVSVVVKNVASIAAGEFRQFVCSDVEHDLANDIDGADITLVEPLDPPPAPPTSNDNVNAGNTSSGMDASGGGADGQVDQFVNLLLRQVGDSYVFGAEARASDPDPSRFDCCLTGDSMISTGPHRTVPITEIEPGDTVLTWSDGGILVENKVIAVAAQPAQPVFAVHTHESLIRASANHPFLVLRQTPQWVRVDELKHGDRLVRLTRAPLPDDIHQVPPGHAFSVERVRAILADGEEETFDLEIENSHNYIANMLVVHNSELVEWAAGRVGISPRVPDGSLAQINHCRTIPVSQAINTKGALLYHPGHIAVSLGGGRTVEAQNPRVGVVQGSASGRNWTRGGLIPGAKGYR